MLVDTQSSEHRELASTVRAVVATTLPPLNRRDVEATRASAASELHAELVVLGLAGIGIPERVGGSGGTITELAIVAKELGRALSPCSMVPAAVVAALLAEGDHDELLGDMATGARVACALPQPGWSSPTGVQDLRVDVAGTQVIVSGSVTGAVGTEAAEVLLAVPASGPPVLVPLGDPGVTVASRTTMAHMYDLSNLRLDRVASVRVGLDDAAVQRAIAVGRTVLACEMLGANEAVQSLAVDHTTHRTQFGQPLGSFQAVAHRLAGAHVRQRAAAAAASYALRSEKTGDFALAAAIARDLGARSLIGSAHEAIQVHGALAYTWEHSVHHYVKYARVAERLLASPGGHLADLVRAARTWTGR